MNSIVDPPPQTPSAVPEFIAAIDLGSNSFHMIVAKTVGGHFTVVDRMREMVRLASGLDQHNCLSAAAIDGALACLQRFGERISELPPGSVRVVGTNTLRKANNSFSFVAQAETALGHPIDVISGHEEARLIYLGVSHGLEDDADIRLVIDIGGGSTEFILGRQFEPLYLESLHMGCVSMTQQFFPDGLISKSGFSAAEIAAQQELDPCVEAFRRIGWQSVVGASGTNLAIRDVVTQAGWSEDGITRHSLDRLKKALLDAGHHDRLKLQGLSQERSAVFAGGVAVLRGAFEQLGIEQLLVSNSALREGLLYDLIGRIHEEDVRELSVDSLIERYRIEAPHAQRIATTAEQYLTAIASDWGIDLNVHLQMINWAARLHEIGNSISHSQYHKHGAYLLNHLELPGFARGEQQRLAALVRGHRRKFPLAEFERLPAALVKLTIRLCVILRLAVVMHRSRSESAVPQLSLKADGNTLILKFPAGWIDLHPLTAADLNQEAAYLKAVGIKLKYR